MKRKNRFLNFWESKQVANPFSSVSKHYVPHIEENKEEPTFEERIEEAREELISDLNRYEEEILNTEEIEEIVTDIPVEHDHIKDDGTEIETVEINTTEEEKEIIKEYLKTIPVVGYRDENDNLVLPKELDDDEEQDESLEDGSFVDIVEEPTVEEIVKEAKPKRGRKKKVETTEEIISEE